MCKLRVIPDLKLPFMPTMSLTFLCAAPCGPKLATAAVIFEYNDLSVEAPGSGSNKNVFLHDPTVGCFSLTEQNDECA